MKRASFLLVVAAGLWAGACGGGGTIPPPPPPPNNGFSNSSMQGQYAFSMSGSELTASGVVPFVRVGSFTADGTGGISGGSEDVTVAPGGTTQFDFTGGTYSINSDGRGTLSLIDSSGTLAFSVTMATPSSGYIMATPTDSSSTASGSFAKQNAGSFTLSGVSGNYTFDFSGVDPTGLPESVVGEFQANGTGQFTTGLADDNDGGTITSATAISGTYADDNLHPGHLAAFGRAAFTVGGVTGVLYIVGPSQAKFMETGSGGTLAGDAMLQSGIPTTTAQISSGFVYVMGGAGGSGPLVRGGKFSASGGALSSIFVDNNNAGVLLSLGPTNGTSTGTYTIDSSGDGRGTITFQATGQTNKFQYVFYLISPTQAVVQDQSIGIVADGSMLAQGTGSITTASLAGNYAMNWSGVTVVNGGNASGEEDLLGEATFSSAGALTGTVDFNEFATGAEFGSVGMTGNLKLASDPTSHNALTVNLATNPANNGITAFAYVANNNTILLMGTQNTVRITAGVMTSQAP